MIGDFFSGLFMYRKAHWVIKTHRLWPWLLLPGLFSLILMTILIVVGMQFSAGWASAIYETLIPEFMKGGITLWLSSFFVWVLLLVGGYLLYRDVVLILFAPVLSWLSEITEKKISGQEAPPFQFQRLLADILRGARINLRYLFRTILFTILAWFTVFLPVVGVILSPLLIYLIQAYYGGAGLVDSTLERRSYSVAESIGFVRTHRGAVSGVGTGFIVMILIPIVGWFTAPAYGIVAGTLMTLKKIEADDANAVQE